MRLRSHIGRALDLRNRWNLAIVALTLLATAVGVALTLSRGHGWWFPVQVGGGTFLAWALTRELDPDRQPAAIVAAVGGGAWAAAGLPTALLPFAAVLLSARLLSETTGRRPLPADLGALVALAGIVSYTRLGWVAGFGLAVAIYLDVRLSGEPSRIGVYAAIGAAAASSVVASLVDTFPQDIPRVDAPLVAGVGLLALLVLVREPSPPVSFVDSRDRRFLRQDRVHTARALVAVIAFAAAVLTGEQALAVGPMAIALVVAALSSEVDRIARAGRPA